MRNRVELEGAPARHIMNAGSRWTGSVLPLFAGLVFGGNALAAPCFAIDGTKVAVNQLFAGGKPEIVDLEDMPSVSTMVSHGSEAHNMIFMNVKRDAAKKNVTSFSAKIDDKNYEFPKNACPK